MIRPYIDCDLLAIVAMVQQDTFVQRDEIEEMLQGASAWVFDDGAILGCAALSPVTPGSDRGVVNAKIYVAPESRGKGIASMLWEEVRKQLADTNEVRIFTSYRCDVGNSRDVFVHWGFEPWFSWHLMRYDGPNFTEPTLEVVPYNDELFGDFVRLRNEGFRELRRQCNIEPYDVYPAGFNEAQVREKLLRDRDNIFVVLYEGRPVAFTYLGDVHIETIAVDEDYRGKGIGRKVTQFSVNKLRERGASTVFLGVLDVNKAARGLYESLGFEFVETTENARTAK